MGTYTAFHERERMAEIRETDERGGRAHVGAEPRAVLRPGVGAGRGQRHREQIQEHLDAGEAQDCRLIGVSGIPASTGGASGAEGASGCAVILFWDTQTPSFGRSGG